MKEKNKEIEQIIKNLEEQGILEAIGDGVSIQDTDFKVLYQNQVHKNIIGDHAGEYCYEAYEQREKTCEGCPVAMAFKDGKTNTTERSIPTEKGIIYIEVTASPIRDSSGKIIAGIEVARDITERKRTEKALMESETKFRRLSQEFQALLDAIPDNLTLQSPDLKVLWANHGAAFGLGREVSDLIDQYCYKLWHDRSTPCERCPVQKSFRTGNTESDIVSTPDGRIWELRTVPIKNENGGVLSVIEVGRDITERKKMEKEVKERIEELEKFYEMAIGRELKMKELKDEIKRLQIELAKYQK
ncbi:MAG: PAS domain-containing protein [Thermodesulfovibrionia bacterium]|nr:PAS domain-containing protein [Thermodesulfovibrionia bacterium]